MDAYKPIINKFRVIKQVNKLLNKIYSILLPEKYTSIKSLQDANLQDTKMTEFNYLHTFRYSVDKSEIFG